MAPKWTDEQLQAMENTGKLTVLSAAAGSGKTTVLVERAIRLLLDESNPVPADKMLIVTFSNASAAEFRKRIEKSINDRLKSDPQNNYIKLQKIALQKADISTIHAFCIKLVRENFQSLDISLDFTICDDAQSDSIHAAAIEQAMAYGYTKSDFKELVSFYGKSSSDDKIRTFLREMDNFFSALPHPVHTAAQMANKYGRYADIALSPAFKQIAHTIKNQRDYLLYLANRMDYIYENSDFSGYENGILLIKNLAEKIFNFSVSGNYSALSDILGEKMPTLGKAKPSCDGSEAVKIVYKEFKTVAEKIQTSISYLDPDNYIKQTEHTKPYVHILFDVFFKYQEALLEIKKSRKMFEFSDFEHFALQLLQNEDGTPTELGILMQERYKYIMEDEFQDTSYVQDAIFTAIARENQSNLFVVGDVKQSIYGFRKASPEIFLQKRQIGLDDPNIGRTVFLPHNFRSEYAVIQGVNRIFSNLMSNECGGVEYDENEMLKTLKLPDSQIGVQLNIYAENEAENTAAAISRMIKDGYMIQDGDIKRPVRSGDFCILMRNTKHFKEYKEALEKLGFEAFVRDDELILQKPEVENIISLMRVISNPLQEVYLTATMFGDIFGFSLDEILKIKMCSPGTNLYKALALSENEKAYQMLELLKDFTYAAQVFSPDKLIDYICRQTGYYRRLSFSEDGSEKRENIRWFVDFAKNWATTHQSDLPAFLRWIDMYLESGKGGSQQGEKSENAVAIMTMHTSKGLEFPVCFVCGLATKFNIMDSFKRFMLDTSIGIGMYDNDKFGYNSSTLNIHAIKNKIRENSANEEMRLLYVAFTRSKNLLVMSAAYNKTFTANTIAKVIACNENKPHPTGILSASTPIQWIFSALTQHPAISDRYTFTKGNSELAQHIQINLNCDFISDMPSVQEENDCFKIKADIPRILENLSYSYPHMATTALPIKLSVSEISKSGTVTLSKPDFAKDKNATAAEKGTAMHKFAQHADILQARADLQTHLTALENMGLIETQLLDISAIERFLESDVATLILNSQKVYTEKDFLVPYPADKAMDDPIYENDEVLIQGTMDCVLQNGDDITVIDYKTDRVSDMNTLLKRYSKQLDLYRYGAKWLFKSENVKCILYSFHLNEYIIF